MHDLPDMSIHKVHMLQLLNNIQGHTIQVNHIIYNLINDCDEVNCLHIINEFYSI